MSVKLVDENCRDIAKDVGQLCMQYPKNADGIIRRGNEIAGLFDKHIISFIASKDNMWSWDLSKLKEFISVVENIENLIHELYVFARS